MMVRRVRSTVVRRLAATVATSLLAVVVLASAAMAGPPDHAGGDRTRGRPPTLVCGELPTRDVVLRADLTCPSGFHFGPTDPPVTIDLGGYALTVPGAAGRCTAPGPCGAIAGAAEVRNGTVIGTLSDIGEVGSVVVVGDVEARLGFSGTPGPAAVHDSVILDGFVRVWGPDVTVAANIIRGGVVFVSTNQAVRGAVVEGNWIVESPAAGISVRPEPGSFPGDIDGRIRRNVIWGATGAGIEVAGGIWNIGSLVIEQNLLVGNGAAGLRSGTSLPGPPTALGGPVTVTGNVAMLNGGQGIDAGWMTAVARTGVVDGGGNRAYANAAGPGCVGVAC